jgi:hypothetical protein
MARVQWRTADCAAFLEISPGAWRNYYSRRVPKHNPAPEPDGYYDARTPWWWDTTVKRWHQSRPSVTAA